jgi:hypothetical protein
MAKYLDSFSASKQGWQKVTFVDAHIASVRLRIMQRISVLEQNPPTLSGTLEDQRLDHQNAITVIGLCSDSWHVTGQFTKPPTSMAPVASSTFSHSFAFGKTSITLDSVMHERPSHYSQSMAPRVTVLGLLLSSSRGTVTQDSVQFISDGISVELDHIGPEYLVGTGLALASVVRKLSKVQQKWSEYSTSLTRQILYNVLVCSKDKSVIDPLSTIQPSYLVQSGWPHELRTDTTFKFLFHLRSCLWHLNDNERHAFECATQTTPVLDDLVPMLESRLRNLASDADAWNVVNQATAETLCPRLGIHPRGHKQTSGTYLRFVSLRVRRVGILARDPSTTSSSEFSICPVALTVHIRSPAVIHATPAYGRTFSQVSLHEPARRALRHIAASICAGDINLTVVPYLMRLAQKMLRIRRSYTVSKPLIDHPPVDAQRVPSDQLLPYVLADITLSLQRLRIRAAAENLIFELGTSGTSIASGVLLSSEGYKNQRDQSMNHTVIFDDIFLRARSPADASKGNDQDVLASIVVGGGKINAVTRQELSNMTTRATSSISSVHISVPRSALRLYHFVEEWRADFLPGIEATLRALLSELEKAPQKPLSPVSSQSSQKAPIIHVHGYLESFRISLQVMHGTWLSWEVNQTVLYLKSPVSSPHNPSHAFGLQLASQIFAISSKPSSNVDVGPGTRLKLELPKMSLTGQFDDSRIHTLASVKFVHFKVKPSHWDTLLAVQQKFGQDFNNLLLLMGETRRKRTVPSSPKASVSLKYSGLLKMSGFRIGLESASSVAYLECEDIDGGIGTDDDQGWHLRLSDLGLSLAPRTADSRQSASDKNRRSAFVAIDFQISSGSRDVRQLDGHVLQISSTKMHAVMQPSSIGEVGDFIDHLQVNIHSSYRHVQTPDHFHRLTCWIVKSKDPPSLKHSKPRRRASWKPSKYTCRMTHLRRNLCGLISTRSTWLFPT